MACKDRTVQTVTIVKTASFMSSRNSRDAKPTMIQTIVPANVWRNVRRPCKIASKLNMDKDISLRVIEEANLHVTRDCVFISDARHSSIYKRLNFNYKIYKVVIKIGTSEKAKNVYRNKDKATKLIYLISVRRAYDIHNTTACMSLPQRVRGSWDTKEITNPIPAS